MHPNSLWLIKWWDRLAPIVNGTMKENIDLCRELAYTMGEEGKDYPSENAIQTAKVWEEKILQGEKPWERND